MKTIVISGINIVDGGAKSVYDDLLNAIASTKQYERSNFILLVSRKNLFKKYWPYFKIIEFPKSKQHWINRLYYEYFYFKKLSKEIKPDIWLSLHDITPNVVADKRYVYCHNPSPFYNMKLSEAKYGWKYYLFSKFYKYLYRINIHKNTAVIVQQNWMADAFKKMYHLDNIIVAKPSVSTQEIPRVNKESKKYSFIYPSFPRPFKNFETLCKATKKLNEEGLKNKFEVFITLDGTENKYSGLLKKRYGNVSNLNFIGLQSRKSLYDYYSRLDCLVFMSKLETWGMPVTEFKQTGRPIILSDLPYAHETAEKYSNVAYVNPDDFISLSEQMKKAIFSYRFDYKLDKHNIKLEFKNFDNWNELTKSMFK